MSKRDHRILIAGAGLVAAVFIVLGTLAGMIALSVYLVAGALLAGWSDPKDDELELVEFYGVPYRWRAIKKDEAPPTQQPTRQNAIITLVLACLGALIWAAMGLWILVAIWLVVGVGWCALGFWLGNDAA